MKAFLSKEHIAVDGVYQVSSRALGLRGTPTFLIVDPNGLVLRVFAGTLDEPQQEEVLKIVRTGAL